MPRSYFNPSKLVCLFGLLLGFYGLAQSSTITHAKLDSKQKIKFAYNNGAYVQNFRSSQTYINSGDQITVKQFITGYGDIDYSSAKISFITSTDILESSSTVKHGLTFDNKNNLKFEAYEQKLTSFGYTLQLGHTVTITNKDSSYTQTYSYFDDAKPKDSLSTQLLSEIELVPSKTIPISWFLKTKTGIPPGKYYLSYTLTYYNGAKWVVDEKKIEITIMNWFERNDALIKYLAFATTILAFAPIVNWFRKTELNARLARKKYFKWLVKIKPFKWLNKNLSPSKK